MNLKMVGCNHRNTELDLRQQLAFDGSQSSEALDYWQAQFPDTEMVLLSTCNRVELYAASNGSSEAVPTDQLVDALLGFKHVSREQINGRLLSLDGREVVRHLYRVTSSLDSMVVGEPQILAQVKQAYQQAQDKGSTGPLLHGLFQSALRTAKRVTGETSLHRHRVSIPSVAISELASCVFESFDDKHVLLIGAGEMAEETLRYLRDVGKPRIHVVNRRKERGAELAAKWDGQYHPWEQLWEQLSVADLAISTTSADEPVVPASVFTERVVPERNQRPLFVLDLAVPRDFEITVGDALGVYLYSLDDLDQACQQNREARAAELPAAEEIVTQEANSFVEDLNQRMTAPVISELMEGVQRPKTAELDRLFNKLPDLDPESRKEIEKFADRLVSKIMHRPLTSLRDASRNGTHHKLIDAMKRLFHLED